MAQTTPARRHHLFEWLEIGEAVFALLAGQRHVSRTSLRASLGPSLPRPVVLSSFRLTWLDGGGQVTSNGQD